VVLFFVLLVANFEVVVLFFFFLYDFVDLPDLWLSIDLRLPSRDLDLDLCLSKSSFSCILLRLNSRIVLSQDLFELLLDFDLFLLYLSEACTRDAKSLVGNFLKLALFDLYERAEGVLWLWSNLESDLCRTLFDFISRSICSAKFINS